MLSLFCFQFCFPPTLFVCQPWTVYQRLLKQNLITLLDVILVPFRPRKPHCSSIGRPVTKTLINLFFVVSDSLIPLSPRPWIILWYPGLGLGLGGHCVLSPSRSLRSVCLPPSLLRGVCSCRHWVINHLPAWTPGLRYCSALLFYSSHGHPS